MNRIAIGLVAVLLPLAMTQTASALPGAKPGFVLGGSLGATKVQAMRSLEKFQFPNAKFKPATFTRTGRGTWSAQAVAKLPPGLRAMPIVIEATVKKTGQSGSTAYEASPVK